MPHNIPKSLVIPPLTKQEVIYILKRYRDGGIGIERIFPLHSPLIDSLEVTRQGSVRRAKLYYLRGLQGRAARIKEKALPRRQRGEQRSS